MLPTCVDLRSLCRFNLALSVYSRDKPLLWSISFFVRLSPSLVRHYLLPDLLVVMSPFTRLFLTVNSASQCDACSADMEMKHLDPARLAIQVFLPAVDPIVHLTAFQRVLVTRMSKSCRVAVFAVFQGSIVWAGKKASLFDTYIWTSTEGSSHVVRTQVLENGFVDMIGNTVEEFFHVFI